MQYRVRLAVAIRLWLHMLTPLSAITIDWAPVKSSEAVVAHGEGMSTGVLNVVVNVTVVMATCEICPILCFQSAI